LKGRNSLDPSRYALPYRELKVVDPDAGYSAGDPVKITLRCDDGPPRDESRQNQRKGVKYRTPEKITSPRWAGLLSYEFHVGYILA